jgi:hypothetical protein
MLAFAGSACRILRCDPELNPRGLAAIEHCGSSDRFVSSTGSDTYVVLTASGKRAAPGGQARTC